MTMHMTTALRRQTFRTRRALFPLLAALLLLAALAVAPPAMPARAAANVVTDCGNDATASGTLPYAVANAANGDTITFNQDCTITLAAALIPAVNVTIDATAPAHTVTISGGGNVELFAVNNVTLSLRGLTFTGGKFDYGGAVSIAGTGVASVDASGVVTALTGGTTTITITGAAGTGLMPAPQPMAHASAPTAAATPDAQPGRHP